MSTRGHHTTSEGRDTLAFDRSSSTLNFAMDSDRDQAQPTANLHPQTAQVNQPQPQGQLAAPGTQPPSQQPPLATAPTNAPGSGATGPQTPSIIVGNAPARPADTALSPTSPQNVVSPVSPVTQGLRSSLEKFDDDSFNSGRAQSPPRNGQTQGLDAGHSIPRHPGRAAAGPGLRRARTGDTHASRRSAIDWIVPVEEQKELPPRPKTVAERLDPTLTHAVLEREKHALKAKMTGWALNVAIGLQVLLGALTTGLSAVTSGKQTSIMTSILGGLSTLVASYLARARGSNEPELSITRVKDLEHFIRECEAFKMDHGHKIGDDYLDRQLSSLRQRFEDLLGNASGERKLSPPA
ncbi:hypothetical protein HGRIS_010810 [Hohenbuehelia grisea]|uniref:SMODS and SLOG-associating 2TM effector domain-containing protein n=1 Tax=Hohenbuehelia grisea TaxID=104357 RepID=A0ABR3IY58_9AGAR